jgi:hypothetical protein
MPLVYTVTQSARIASPGPRVYGILADYKSGHPRILPPAFFGLTVERGGVGEGTSISFQMRAFGRTHHARAEVTEPQPGRVLREAYLDDKGTVTTFTVNPVQGGCEVTIETELQHRGGLLGKLEQFLLTRYLLPIYREELALLDQVARG